MATIDIKAVDQFTISGNTEATNDIASIAEVQVKKIIFNELATMGLRGEAIAMQLSSLLGVGTAIYRRPNRNNVGTDYDFDKGTKARRTGAQYASVDMNQKITAKVIWEQFDTERYMASAPAVRSTLVGEWINSIFLSFFASKEAIYLRGVVDYSIATGRYKVLGLKGLKTFEEARQAYFDIKSDVIDMTDTITKNMLGASTEDIMLGVSRRAHLGLVKAHIADSGTEITHATLAKGNIYQNTILNTLVQENFYLDKNFVKGDINNDLSFDLLGVEAILNHNQAVANPSGWEINKIVEDNETLNPKFILKAMGSLPVVFYPELIMVYLTEEPSEERIAAAKAAVWDGNDTSYNCSYKLAEWDTLEKPEPEKKNISEIVKVLDGGYCPVPTNDDIPELGQVAQVVIDNNKGVSASDINITGVEIISKPVEDPEGTQGEPGKAKAVCNGAGKYEGSVNITFNYGRKYKSKKELNEALAKFNK